VNNGLRVLAKRVKDQDFLTAMKKRAFIDEEGRARFKNGVKNL